MELRFITSLTPEDIQNEAILAIKQKNSLYIPCELEYNVYQYEVDYTTVRGNYHKYTGYYVGKNSYGEEFREFDDENKIEILVKPLREKDIIIHGVQYFRQIGKVTFSYEYGKKFLDCCTSKTKGLLERLKKTHPKNICLGGVNLLIYELDYEYKTVRGNLRERRAYTVCGVDITSAAESLEKKIESFNQKHEYRKLIDVQIPVSNYVLGNVRVA